MYKINCGNRKQVQFTNTYHLTVHNEIWTTTVYGLSFADSMSHLFSNKMINAPENALNYLLHIVFSFYLYSLLYKVARRLLIPLCMK